MATRYWPSSCAAALDGIYRVGLAQDSTRSTYFIICRRVTSRTTVMKGRIREVLKEKEKTKREKRRIRETKEKE